MGLNEIIFFERFKAKQIKREHLKFKTPEYDI